MGTFEIESESVSSVEEIGASCLAQNFSLIFTYDRQVLKSFEGVGHYSIYSMRTFDIESEFVSCMKNLRTSHLAQNVKKGNAQNDGHALRY
jgi:hypothetical protein